MDQNDDMDTLATKQPPSRDTRTGGSGSNGKARGSNSTAAHKALITRNLRLVYGEVAGENMPDRFLDLLGQLDNPEDKRS